VNRLLLADDHPMIRTALDVLLRDSTFDIVGMAATVGEAIAKVGELSPDMLLLDLNMPGGSGMDVLRRVRSDHPGLKVIMLTAGIDDRSLMDALDLKVDGIVLKNSDPAHLLHCLEQVSQKRHWIDPELAERAKALEEASLLRTPLAPRERQLILFVREGLRNREIAEKLGVTEGTVKTYLHSVFEKVGVSNRTELAMRATDVLGGGGV
jgi:two-component system nitrate/nitrite response regulator NarL